MRGVPGNLVVIGIRNRGIGVTHYVQRNSGRRVRDGLRGRRECGQAS